MDSGNSSSRDVDLVSSAEEDYDDPHQHCGSPPSSATSRFFLGNQIPPPPVPSTSSPSLFDSFSSFLEPFPGSPNLDPGWQRSVKRLASSPMAALSSSSPSPFVGATTPINSGATQPSDAGSMYQRAAVEAVGPAPPAIKSGKKRSRASRRAPTTVLTTDTTNFRQMVQEFTGIPAPPFVSTSPFSRTAARLDLLAAAGGGAAAAPPSFLLRPFSQKPQILTMANTTINNTIANNCNSDVNNPSSSAPASASLGKESAQDFLLRPQNNTHSGPLLSPNLPNTLFNLQSLMNLAPSKFQLPNFLPGKLPSAGLSSFPASPMSTTMSVGAEMNNVGGVLNEFGGSSCHVGLSSQGNVGAPNMTNSMNMSTGNLPTVGSSRVFLGGIADGGRGGGGSGGGGGGGESNDNQVGIRPIVAVGGGDLCNPQRGGGSSCKLNYSASSSDFHVEKGSEGMPRGEGMVDSWICSSD